MELEGSQGNFEVAYNTFHDFGTSSPSNNFGAALSLQSWGNGNYTPAAPAACTTTSSAISLPAAAFSTMATPSTAVCGHQRGDPDPRIYNNLIANEGSIAIQLWHAADHILVYKHTIDKAHMAILVGVG